MITQFLGGPFGTISTPPLDAYGEPQPLPVPTTAPPAAVPVTTTPASSQRATPTTVAPAASDIPSYDPRPC